MNKISKEKFLKDMELLLSFMSEKDRATAIAIYKKLFEENTDEDSLIACLISPVKQAAMIARYYNVKELVSDTEKESEDCSDTASDEKADECIKTENTLPLNIINTLPDTVATQEEYLAESNDEAVNGESILEKEITEEIQEKETVPEEIISIPNEIQFSEAPVTDSIDDSEKPQHDIEKEITESVQEKENLPEEIINNTNETQVSDMTIQDSAEEPKKPQNDFVEAAFKELLEKEPEEKKITSEPEIQIKEELPESVAAEPVESKETIAETPIYTAPNYVVDVENMRFASDFEGLEEPNYSIDDIFDINKYPEEEEKPKKKGGLFGFLRNRRKEEADDYESYTRNRYNL